MRRELVISYPHMGDYAVVFRQFFRHVFPGATVLSPPPISRKTVELGEKHSPDFVCSPFKYNIGNYIEALELGANALFQTGIGCRYGYYGELQEQILRDLGYDFRFVCLSRERARPRTIMRSFRELGCSLPALKVLHSFIVAVASIYAMDRFEYWMRENIGFELFSGTCESVREALLKDIAAADSIRDVIMAARRCKENAAAVRIDKPEHPIRVGVVGELYTLMEPFSNFFLERQLAHEGIVVSRVMSIWFLLFGRNDRRSLRKSEGYLQYAVGANGLDSVSQSLGYARRGYDGIVHMHSFGCIPELSATPALHNLSRDKKLPILHLSFDAHTSETGVQTRLEAFADMLRGRKERENANEHEPRRRYRFGVHEGGRP